MLVLKHRLHKLHYSIYELLQVYDARQQGALHSLIDQNRTYSALYWSEMFLLGIGSLLPALHWWWRVLLKADALTVQAQNLPLAVEAPLPALPRFLAAALQELWAQVYLPPLWCWLSFLCTFNSSSNLLIISLHSCLLAFFFLLTLYLGVYFLNPLEPGLEEIKYMTS